MPHHKDILFRVKTISKEEDMSEDNAFVLFILRDVLGLEQSTYEEAMQAGGKGDCGIDAFWSDEETIYILQAKFYKDSLKVKEGDIDSFILTPDYLSDPTIIDSQNGKLITRGKRFIKQKAEEYKDLKESGLETNLLFVTSSSFEPKAEKKIVYYKKTRPNYRLDFWDGHEVYNQFISNKKHEQPDVDFELVDEQYFDTKNKKNLIAPYAVITIRGTDLFDAYNKYKQSIFTQNLRYFLGKGGKINKEIKTTIEDSNKRNNFWYYNNGLTIICDDFEIDRESKKIHIKNLQIVNGGQTTRSIYEALLDLGKEPGREVLVMARVIKTKDNESLIEQIRDYNNRQNPTKARDFVSHNKKQQELQPMFQNLGYYYEVKRGESSEDYSSKIIKTRHLKIVDNLTVAQAHFAFSGHPAEAKSQKNQLLQVEGGHYNAIFTDAISATELLFSYLCYDKARSEYRLFNKRHSQRDQDEYLAHGTTHIVAIMGSIARKVLDLAEYFDHPEKFKKLINHKAIDIIYDQAKDYLEDIYADKLFEARSAKTSFVPSKYFKNIDMADHILEKVERKLKKDKTELEKKLGVILV